MADTAGLLVGDMILSVNGEDFVGASYETAAKVILCFPPHVLLKSKIHKFTFTRYFNNVCAMDFVTINFLF